MLICNNEKINSFNKNNLNNLNKEEQCEYIQEYMPTIEDITEECSCPKCGAINRFKYHGIYSRNISFLVDINIINSVNTVTRVKCESCDSTHALLPNFITPYKIMNNTSVLEIVSTTEEIPVLDTAKKYNISFQLIYAYITLLLSFFPEINILNNKMDFKYSSNFNEKYFLLNCINICNIEFYKDYFMDRKWVFLMEKFRNNSSPRIYIGLIP